MSNHTEHTKRHPSTFHIWWLSNILLILTNTGHAQQHIAQANTYNPGIYHTFRFGDFITNTPDNNHAVVFDHEKGRLYYKDTDKKVKARRVYGFCDGEQVYLTLKKFNPVEKVDRYTYFREKGFEIRMIFLLGPTPLAIPFPVWYNREYVANLNNGNIYQVSKKLLRQILQSDEDLYSGFKEDKKRKKRYLYYVVAYNDRNRGRIKKPGGSPQG